MASATDTGKADPPGRAGRFAWRLKGLGGGQGRFAGSRLGWLILFLNLISLIILFVGALLLNEWRRGLVDARLESLTVQAELIANILSEAQATRGEPTPALDAIGAGLVLRDNFIPRGQRARLFDANGLLLVDSYEVSEAVYGEPLPTALPSGETPPPPPDVTREQARIEDVRRDLAREVQAAMTDGRQAGLRRSESGERVVSVSLPVRHVQAVLGVLTLEAGDVDETLAAQRMALMPFAFVALAVSLLTSLLIHLFVVRPVLRLSTAADQVRMQRARAIDLPDLQERKDEIGDLARSLGTMTTALSERMDAIERFAADVSHEIKNPLTSIRSALETLELVRDEAAKAKMTAVLQQDVARLDRLITDISRASRLDAELSREPPRPVDLARLLGDIAGAYAATARKDEAMVRFETALPGRVLVMVREEPLGQVFRNLIDNALSFSPPGRPVRVILNMSGSSARVSVEDAGPGLPPENLETVFERFYTSRPRGAAFGGNSGLGLSIARQIVEAHGGRIHAENRTDESGRTTGARFVVALPAARAGAEAPPKAVKAKPRDKA